MKSNINYGSVAASSGTHTRQFSRDLLFENWFFKDSPYWTFWVHDVDGLEVKTHKHMWYCHLAKLIKKQDYVELAAA